MEGRSMDIGHPKYDPSMKEEPATPKKSAPVATATKAKPTTNPSSPKSDGFWPMYVVGVLVVAVIVFFGVRAASSLVDVWTDLSPSTVTDSKNLTETDVASTEEGATPVSETPAAETPAVEEATPAAEEAAPAAAAPAIDKASLKIRVLNGNGTPGAADEAKAVLVAAGFTVDSTGNARQFNYASTIVYYPAGKADQAQLVADNLTGYTISKEENAVADGYDALVVIGEK